MLMLPTCVCIVCDDKWKSEEPGEKSTHFAQKIRNIPTTYTDKGTYTKKKCLATISIQEHMYM